MDFLTFEQAKQAKLNGLPYPPDNDDCWFGMLFETEQPYYQVAFVGTGQWELFKQHCINNGVWRATPTDLLRAMPPGWALYIDKKTEIRTEWICKDINGTEEFRSFSPCEAVFDAWCSLIDKADHL